MSEFDRDKWIADRKKKRDEIFGIVDEQTKHIVSSPSEFKKFLDVQSRLSNYSAVNALLVLNQLPKAKKLQTFEEWSDQKISIKSGEKAIMLFEPYEYTKDDGTTAVGYNIKSVFDVSQTNSREKITFPVKSPASLKNAVINSFDGIEETDIPLFEIVRDIAADNISQHSDYDVDFKATAAAYMVLKKYGVNTDAIDLSVPERWKEKETKYIRKDISSIRSAFSEINNAITEYYKQAERNMEER